MCDQIARRPPRASTTPTTGCISSTDALGGITTTVYDANGNVIQTTTPDGMITDSVYDAQGQVIYTDDPHLPGEPTNGTHTIYDQDGNVIGTEELANVVITVTTTGGVSSERSDLGGLGPLDHLDDLRRRRPRHPDRRRLGHGHQQYV